MRPQLPTIVRLAFMGCLVLVAQHSHAQVFTVTNTTVTINGHAHANDFIIPLGGGATIFDVDSCTFAPQPWVAGFYGNDFAYLCNRSAREKKTSLPQSETSSQLFSYGRANGVNTGSMVVNWSHETKCYTNSLEGYQAFSGNELTFTVTVTVTGPPNGTPVTVYADYSSSAWIHTHHEDVNEDPASCVNTLTIDGTEVLQGTHDFFNPPGLNGYNERLHQPIGINVLAGIPFDISVTSNLATRIDLPFVPYGFYSMFDKCVAAFYGSVNLNMSPPEYNNNTIGNGQIEFSLDIGSDAELSDPQADGDEVFDPGDAYLFGGAALPSGGSNGIQDDASLFGSDPAPTPPDPTLATAAPTGSGIPLTNVLHQFFDLDGLDNIATDLSQMNLPVGQSSTPPFFDPGIFPAQFVFVSFDDDSLPTYLDPAGAVAVNSSSPIAFSTYGQTANKDEVTEIDFSPTYPTAVMYQYGLYDEIMIHTNMTPNPDSGETADDDVDALDMNPGMSQTPFWYFSADHEAVYTHQAVGGLLNPGSIYEMTGTGSITEVVNPITNLGLPDSVDVDAFEFVWLYDTLQIRNGFAMLFSVDDDDPLTTADESGGLNPRHIYASFMNGTYFRFTVNPLEEDIDAIATWQNSLNGTLVPAPVGIGTQARPDMSLNAYPNPFTDNVSIGFALVRSCNVRIAAYDASGRLVTFIAEGNYGEGSHSINWNSGGLAEGCYELRMYADGMVVSHKLVKL